MIAGSNFGPAQGNGNISFNGTSATTITSWGAGSITVTVPSGATTGNVVVTAAGGVASGGSNFTVIQPPSITNVSPTVGAVGAEVAIAGANFGATQGTGSVTFNGTAATPTSWSTSTIAVPVPSGATTGNVVVNTTGGSSNAVAFTVASAPNITSLSVTSGVVGTSVTITGTNFGSTEGTGTVSFNGTDATPTSWSATSIITTVPAGATTGSVVVSASGVASNGIGFTVIETLGITGMSPTSGVVGEAVTLTGAGFGANQGTSTLKLNGTTAAVTSWTDTAIVASVPSGASTGPFTATVNGNAANSLSFTVTSLPSGWTDGDIGSVGIAGSASFGNGTFTANGAGGGTLATTTDGVNFVYQPLSGDGTIIARVVSAVGGGSQEAGVMIRETLSPGASNAQMFYYASSAGFNLTERTSTGATSDGYISAQGVSANPPYWVMLVRSGNTFSGYVSFNGVTWTQVGATETISMAQSVYVGLYVSNRNTGSLATATFDSVSVNSTAAPAPVISSISSTTASIGSEVLITGSGFGATQNGSLVTLNYLPVTINSWSATSILFTVPAGATTGPLLVSVAPAMNDSNAVILEVTSQPLESQWLDIDIGSVGITGSASLSNGTFTANGAGGGTLVTTADGIHFVYQPLVGDGTIVARVVSAQGGGAQEAGVMIRETLSPGASNAEMFYYAGSAGFNMTERTSTGATSDGYISTQALAVSPPYWVKLVRSGNTFNGYASLDGVIWAQIGTTQTISMAQSVYVGLFVSNRSTGSLATATFDSVSINSAAAPAPVISSISSTTASIGSQVVISGSGFGTTQNGSLLTLNYLPVTINSWAGNAILFTVPAGATTGPLFVSVAPTMNDSNAVTLEVTSQPLTSPWLDTDIGAVGVDGSATYGSSTFTVKGAGGGTLVTTTDALHFVYQPLSGDGTIVARVVSTQGGGSQEAGVMIRETLTPGASNAQMLYYAGASGFNMTERTSTGATSDGYISAQAVSATPPYWVMLVRSGNNFNGYASPDGVNWTQVGTTQTISMAQNVYIGLYVSNRNTTSLATATFDGVSISTSSIPAPVITGLSATTGTVGSQVVISGTGFGASEAGSVVTLNDAPITVNSWSNTSIVISIPTGATSGYLMVSVAPSMINSNPVHFSVTTQPLPTPWLDQDIGAVGATGSGTYASGTFSVVGGGAGTYGTSDGLHFVYQSLSGSGSMITRIVTAAGAYYPQALLMIRETMNPGASEVSVGYYSGYIRVYQRDSTGASTSNANYVYLPSGLPYWVELIRNGNTFSEYASPDGVNWTQLGTSQTITMAQNVYIGFASDYGNTTGLTTSTFDNVSFTIGTTPIITGISPALGATGASVTITGTNLGSSQGSSTLSFNGTQATSIASWTNSQIVATVPSGATTGLVTATVNSVVSPSNATYTVIKPTITSVTPPATQTSGIVTIVGSGFGANQSNSSVTFNGAWGSATSWSDTSLTVSVPINATTGPLTVTVDGVSSNAVTFTILEPLTVTGISQSSGSIGTTITITGTGFGATQSNSTLSFYGATATVTNWSDTQITATVPGFSSSGPVSVSVGEWVANGPWFTLTSVADLTDSLGNPTTYTSAVIGGTWVPLNAQGSGCSTCTVRGTISNTYDAFGDLLTHTDELGRITTYTYDINGNLTSVSAPIGPDTFATTQYTYNSFGEVLTTTDPIGNVTNNSYDAHGNLLSVTSPQPNSSTSGSTTQFAYDAKGELTQITDPLGNVTKLTYYPTGLINTITDAQQNVTTYVYDAHGNRTSVTDAMNNLTTFAYDTGDRLKTITYPGSTGTTGFTYDTRGRRTSVTDQNSKTTTYAYDDADRLTTVTDAATPGNVTTYGYDTENNLTSIQDANGHTTAFAYDAFGRVSKTTFPAGTVEFYYYDAVGNLIQKTDRKNQTITYTYDQLNRLLQKSYPDSTAVNYTYDNDSRLTQVVDPSGTYQFTFDNMGRLTGASSQYTFLTGRNFTTSYTYDAASNRKGFTDPENGSTTYAYDTLNRLQTLTQPAAFSGTGSFGFTYDALSRRTQMTRPNSLTTNYSYDNLSRLLSVLHQSGATTLDGASYAVDNAGNRTSRTPQPSGTASNYGYDALYELTSVTQSATTTESYTYDPVGNRLSSLGVSPYAINTSNELTSTPSTTYTYDSNGNTSTKVNTSGTTQYFWDFENRMTSVTLPGAGGTVTFKYDPFGRRIYKSSTSGTSVYAYDGDNLIEETNATGGVVARYEQTQNIDEPLAMLRTSATSYFHADGLGSITSLSNSAGTIANTYTYDSYGDLTASTGTLVNSFRYTGRESDPETGLYYYRARYYDPQISRFLESDPMQFRGGDANLYRYVWNSPLSLRDPRGLWGIGGTLGASFFGGIGSNQGSGVSGSGSVGGVFFKDPAAPNGFTSGGYLSYGVVVGGTRPTSGLCGNNGHNETSGGSFGAGPGIVFTNAHSIGDLAGRFFNTAISLGPISIDVGFGDNGTYVVNLSGGKGFGIGSANYVSNTITSSADKSACGCDLD